MRIARAKATNWCQHEVIEAQFSPFLNCIVGRNGAGKSNLLRALMFGFTGDPDKVLEKMPRKGMKPRDKCNVVLDCFHENIPITLTRGITASGKTTAELVWGDEKPITGATQVNQALQERLGATKQQIMDYVFVRQKSMDAWLTKTPAVRAEELASLFGLAGATKCYDAITRFLPSIRMPSTTIDHDQLVRQAAELNTHIQAADTELLAMAAVPDDISPHLLHYNKVVDDSRRRNMLVEQQSRFTALMIREQEALNAENMLDQSVSADLKVFDAYIAENREPVEEAHKVLQAWGSYRGWEGLRKSVEQCRKGAWNAFLARPAWPPKPAIELTTPLAELNESLGQANAKVNALADRLQQLEGVTGNCPTCGQAWPDAEARAAERETVRASFVEECTRRDACKQRVIIQQTWERLCDNRRTALNRIRALVKDAKDRTKMLAATPAPQASEAEAQKAIEDWNVILTSRQDTINRQAAIHTKIAGHKAAFQSAEQSRAEVMTQLQRIPEYGPAAQQEAVAAIQQLQHQFQAKTQLKANLATLRARLADTNKMLADYAAVGERAERTSRAIEYFNKLRLPFHPSEAPRIVSFTYLERMSKAINETLRLFDTPFSVEPDDTLGFTVPFHDGSKTMTDQDLSVGELLVLALAVRITFNASFVGKFGGLYLDEPTAYLDSHNLGCLPQAITRLRELSRSQGLQVIFVTHEPRIQQLFDQIIEVGV